MPQDRFCQGNYRANLEFGSTATTFPGLTSSLVVSPNKDLAECCVLLVLLLCRNLACLEPHQRDRLLLGCFEREKIQAEPSPSLSWGRWYLPAPGTDLPLLLAALQPCSLVPPSYTSDSLSDTLSVQPGQHHWHWAGQALTSAALHCNTNAHRDALDSAPNTTFSRDHKQFPH